MAGLVPAIPMGLAPCPPDRDRRDEPGDDTLESVTLPRVLLRLLLGMGDRAVVLDQRLAFIDEKFVLAIGAQQLDPGVAQVLVMDVELLVAIGAAWIEMLDHRVVPCGMPGRRRFTPWRRLPARASAWVAGRIAKLQREFGGFRKGRNPLLADHLPCRRVDSNENCCKSFS
jgi:hypothetical protein